MVEDRITDGKRIAQLLASELSGLATPPLDRVTVVDATPAVEPAPEGAAAYGLAVDGERIGTVTVFPDAAVLAVRGTLPSDTDAGGGVSVERGDEEVRIRIAYGAAVKRAVDLVVEIVGE